MRLSTFERSSLNSERSSETRALAEAALLRLLVALDEQDIALVVLGGLVPEILTRGGETPSHDISAPRMSTSTSLLASIPSMI